MVQIWTAWTAWTAHLFGRGHVLDLPGAPDGDEGSPQERRGDGLVKVVRLLTAVVVALVVFVACEYAYAFAYYPLLFEEMSFNTRAEVVSAADDAMGPRWPGSKMVAHDVPGGLLVERRWILWEARMRADRLGGSSWHLDLGVVERGPGSTLQQAVVALPALVVFVLLSGALGWRRRAPHRSW